MTAMRWVNRFVQRVRGKLEPLKDARSPPPRYGSMMMSTATKAQKSMEGRSSTLPAGTIRSSIPGLPAHLQYDLKPVYDKDGNLIGRST